MIDPNIYNLSPVRDRGHFGLNLLDRERRSNHPASCSRDQVVPWGLDDIK